MDTVKGGKSNDSILNNDAGNLILALAGNDSVENYGDNVTIDGGAGNDLIYDKS